MGKRELFFTIAIFIFFFLEFYVYQAIKTVTQNTLIRYAYWGITILVYVCIIFLMLHFNKGDHHQYNIQWMISLVLIFLLPKILIVVFLLFDDISRLFLFGYDYFTHSQKGYPERRKFLSILALGSAGIFSALVIDGIIFGKYRYKVRKLKLKIEGLPEAFKGYKVLQISDVHSGSFHHPEKLEKVINLINEQNADLILFTGDMVNTYADEFEPFVELFGKIKSKDGKLSVLGNHDYGDYGEWLSQKEKDMNIPKLAQLEKMAGFDLLRNEHRVIEKDGQKLYIIGVENWGAPPFPQHGDLNKATKGIPKDAAKILMSHDPTHFDYVVKKHPSNVQLTLSGHTHGMQFGLDLKNIKWSPVEYKYPKWMDLYESEGKYLYVNRGFGVLAYPGRVGIDPEITVFELS